jgi:hypothetical protein
MPSATETALPVHVALCDVMNDVGVVGKDSRNQQQGYAYRGIEALVNALQPVMSKHGVFMAPYVETVEYGSYVTAKKTEMRTATVTVLYRFYGPAGDHIEVRSVGEASDAGDKATSKAMSMALKYALAETFMVRTEDMEDSDASVPEPRQARPFSAPAPAPSAPVVPVAELDPAQQAAKDALGRLRREHPDGVAQYEEWWRSQQLTAFSTLTTEQATAAKNKADEIIAANVPF